MDDFQPQHRSDPHRRLLRHTYQEGPGFLFLATRGGRPPGPAPGSDLERLRFRARCVRTAREEGLAAALALGVSRASLHRWRVAHAAGGLAALGARPRGPRRERLPEWVEQAVIVVRLLTYWNSKRLAAEFSRREIYPLGHRAVDGLLAELGTARPSVRRERGPAYERTRPNELWHIDIKGPFFLRRSAREYEKVWLVGLVDDHSRFLIGLRVLPRPQAAPILAWLEDCLELCGTPLELMSDNGAPFVVWMPGVLTLFGKTLEELRIRHLRTQVNSPWTNGKIERFWGLLQAELLDRQTFRTLDAAADGLTRFATYYNYDRLHGELDWHTPAERYDGTPFTARGFERVPALNHLQGWLLDLMQAA
jgi:transposase InsO family protein